MDTYTIKKAYPWIKAMGEIEITSENLIYTELGTMHSGCQCNNMDNADEIHKLCNMIANLIRKIEVLNASIDLNHKPS
jgi:hypothetical protein